MLRISALPLLTFVLLLPSPPARAAVDFNRDIRPLLSDNCFTCHGFDAEKRKGNLRLDDRAGALAPAKSGKPAIVPGKPSESELIHRILATDADDLMPPSESHKTLTPAQKDILKQWITEGAPYQAHWAFLPPTRPPIPQIIDHKSPAERSETGELTHRFPEPITNPLDAFIQDRLAKENLTAQPEAPRETLIRRVSLDLTGLPPSPAEADAFLADTSPTAYEKVVDRLLASPRYGENMAAPWLDLARYADSNGFQSDTSREQYLWRDWVIRAFNNNLPFDQFTIQQIAGDMLPNATKDQILATGFNRNHRLNGEGGRITEEWFAETVIDRVETTGLTWMALTLGCSRCHDHKYDPISQREFYQLFAYFNSNQESGVLEESARTGNTAPVITLPAPGQEEKQATLAQAVQDAKTALTSAEKELPALLAKWEPEFKTQARSQAEAWHPLEQEKAVSEGGATLTRQQDGTWLAGGKNPEHDAYIITAPLPAGTFTGIQINALPDPSLPAQSLGRYPNGNYVLSDVDAEITAPGMKEPLLAQFTGADADYEQKGWEVDFIVKDKPKRGKNAKNKQGWAVDGPTKKEPRTAVFSCVPLTVPAGATVKITLRHDALAGHNMGRFRIATTSLPPSLVKVKGAAIPKDVLAALDASTAQRTPQQTAALTKFFRENTANPVKQAELTLAAAQKSLAALDEAMPTVMVMKEAAKPRDAFILKRGEYDKPGDKVTRALPAALPPLPPGASNDRLGFAQWLVSGNHPLTARVWVNRQWEKFFGTGLVKTSENFGSQAEWPSHPELLDWLATEFVRLKWDMKAMEKLMVMSAAYRQSSQVTPQVLERDPDNRLLARGPRFRLSAEQVRDQALAVSGLLVEKTGGPSVKPYMPSGVWDETSVYGNMRNYQPDKDEGLYRRTLYTVWKRTAAPPTMLLFDSPNREICTVKRSRTNTPLQALTLLNEVTYVEAARRLAERMLREGGPDPAARIAWAFRTATARAATAAELKILTARYSDRLTKYQANPAAAKQLITRGSSTPDPKLDPAELAASTITANVLLNLDEFITRE